MLKKFLVLTFVSFFIGCSSAPEPSEVFTKLAPNQTGIHFENTIGDVDFDWFEKSPYIFNGAGLAQGDLNNNGLPDLFLAGNLVSSRLYLNKGDFKFEDITEQAGLMTENWIAGVSMVDINASGYLDIYLSVSGEPGTAPEKRANKLFINNGDMTFTEAASEYGIDDTNYGTHAVFFDYNGSGYLDLFLLNNSPDTFYDRAGGSAFQVPRDPLSHDKLYKNNGDGTFTDVSDEAGILSANAYGLGVVVADFNRNGWPDIYISNDSVPNDVLYINNGDGTFTNKAGVYLKQTSLSGMGVDAADFTNNGWPDIIQTDMTPEEINEQKKMSGGNTHDRFRTQREMGLEHYYPKNSMQLNHGVDRDGNIQFSEISRIAGTAYTDWSWATLFGDYNNSGFKDVLIANGYPKDVINHEYLLRIDSPPLMSLDAQRDYKKNLYNELRAIHLPNYIFKNNGGLVFEDVSHLWGFREPGYSYGAAHGDLNNSGRLDVVINNINSPASVYRNDLADNGEQHYLQINLEGEYPNRQGLGAELTLFTGDAFQYIYHTLYRGFQSTMDGRIHFGMGKHAMADSLEIVWPDGRKQVIKNIEADQLITVRQSEADQQKESRMGLKEITGQLFTPVDEELGIDYQHREKRFVDFMHQPTLPYMKSRTGPPLAVGDITGNGLDDLFIGGAAGHPAELYLQNDDGTFTKSPGREPWLSDASFEDTAALFLDVNGNGLQDLYVASGGYHATASFGLLQDRLYMNMGDGRFLRDERALPTMFSNSSCVVPADVTGDGSIYLFVCGNVYPGDYPSHTRSYLLRNDGGRLRDVTEQFAPGLLDLGMTSDAVWLDTGNNGLPVLVTAGVWQPIRIFENDGTSLRETTSGAGLENTRGWWYSLAKGDFNGDGRMDLIAGNLGLNHTFTTSKAKTFGVYANDFDGDLSTDIIYTFKAGRDEYPFFGPLKLATSIANFMEGIPNTNRMAEMTIQEAFPREKLNEATRYQADLFESVQLKNNGDGTFEVVHLPEMAQISPIKGIVAYDADGDGNLDLILAGNIFRTDPDIPRLDAGKGLWLRGDGQGNFDPVPFRESGFLAPRGAKNLTMLQTPQGPLIVVANNEGPLQVFRIN